MINRIEHKKVDAETLPFQSEEFDSCRSERVFQHLLHPECVISEMVRVVKHDGWVVVVDTDWGTGSIDTTETDIERRLARVLAEQTKNNGYAGRSLCRLFKQHGIGDISIELFPLYTTNYSIARQMADFDEVESVALSTGVISEDELKRWHNNLDAAAASDTFFSIACQVLVAGRKP
jgi:ubiquinone/menaquinone biosynthesis C-methylase UbiE